MKTPQEQYRLSHPLVISAQDYATAAHASIGQMRKYSSVPYIVHPREVARLVARTVLAGSERGPDMVAAAWLHDVVEDVINHETRSQAQREQMLFEMKSRFPYWTMRYVLDVTNVATPSDGNRRTRVGINLKHLISATPGGATIKYADIISNAGPIVETDADFAMVYLPEKAEVLYRVRQGDAALHVQAVSVVRSGLERIYPMTGKRHAGSVKSALQMMNAIRSEMPA